MAETANFSTNVAHIMKRRYSNKQSADAAMRDHPMYFEMKKESGWTGDKFGYQINTGNPQGIAGTLAVALANASTIRGAQLLAERRRKYGVCLIDGETLLATEGNDGAFYDVFTKHMDGMLDEMGASLAFDLQGNGTGLRGRLSDVTGNVWTLAEPTDVRNFKRGMTVIAATSATGLSGVRAGTTTVVGIDRANGKITVDDSTDITSLGSTDYIFREGDPGTCIDGLELCTPLTAPVYGSDSFRTIDRGVDIEALAGSRLSTPDEAPEDVIANLAVNIHGLMGKKVKRAAIFPTHFQRVVKNLQAQVQYTNPGGSADIGFETVIVHTAAGPVRLLSDPDVPITRVRLYDPDSHVLKYLGPDFIHVVKDDKQTAVRSSGADSIEVRFRSLGNYLQYDTSQHGVGQLAA